MKATTTIKPFVSCVSLAGVLLYSALLLFSCSKEEGPGNKPDPDEKEQQYQTDIYVAGYESNGRVLMPKCWKNGVPIDLEVGSQGAELYAMTVDGEDIYLAGYTWDSKGWDRIAMYWKNGKAVELIKGRAYAIAVENGDVYAAGTHNIDPVYWKNEKLITLRDVPGNEYVAGIAVNGSDVHTVIRRFPGPSNISEIGSILYSKNGGVLHTLSANGVAFAMALDGNDVYVVGTEWNGSNSVAKYWKNGNAVALSNKSANTIATAITVDRGDVYIAGTETVLGEYSIAKYWKNGIAVALDPGEYDGAYAGGIAVDGDDVYVAGRVWTAGSKSKAGYWKNGTLVTLTDENESVDAVSIVVVKTPVE